jgi:hypothetical protein
VYTVKDSIYACRLRCIVQNCRYATLFSFTNNKKEGIKQDKKDHGSHSVEAHNLGLLKNHRYRGDLSGDPVFSKFDSNSEPGVTLSVAHSSN